MQATWGAILSQWLVMYGAQKRPHTSFYKCSIWNNFEWKSIGQRAYFSPTLGSNLEKYKIGWLGRQKGWATCSRSWGMPLLYQTLDLSCPSWSYKGDKGPNAFYTSRFNIIAYDSPTLQTFDHIFQDIELLDLTYSYKARTLQIWAPVRQYYPNQS